MDVPNGSVSIRPPAGFDGKYDSGSEVVLEAEAGSPDAAFTWSGVDSQTRSVATVMIGDDRFVMVEIDLPPPALAPTIAPAPIQIPTPTAVPAEFAFGWIQGTVWDRWARRNYPLANITVEGRMSGHKARTDSEGRYTLFLPVGLEFITFSSPDIYYPGMTSLNVSAGPVIRTVNFTFTHGDLGPCLGKKPFTVEGVVFAGSSPVNGARVWIWNTSHETTTNEDGYYSIPDGCGELILAESGELRGGVVVKPRPDSVIQAPKISLSPR